MNRTTQELNLNKFLKGKPHATCPITNKLLDILKENKLQGL